MPELEIRQYKDATKTTFVVTDITTGDKSVFKVGDATNPSFPSGTFTGTCKKKAKTSRWWKVNDRVTFVGANGNIIDVINKDDYIIEVDGAMLVPMRAFVFDELYQKD